MAKISSLANYCGCWNCSRSSTRCLGVSNWRRIITEHLPMSPSQYTWSSRLIRQQTRGKHGVFAQKTIRFATAFDPSNVHKPLTYRSHLVFSWHSRTIFPGFAKAPPPGNFLDRTDLWAIQILCQVPGNVYYFPGMKRLPQLVPAGLENQGVARTWFSFPEWTKLHKPFVYCYGWGLRYTDIG